jgi:short-subunit dehydrogenase involved in D-alanine esterification of teichoic acids
MEVIRNALIRRLSGPAKSEGSRKMSTQVVLITGALTGIGRAAALAFAREGHRIAVAGRHEEAGQELVTELRALGTDVEFLRADVRHEDDVRTMVDRTVARFGRVDVAVNNAGTEGQPGPVTQQTANSYAATFDTNVLGTLLSMKHELRVMQAQGSGSIVNISRESFTEKQRRSHVHVRRESGTHYRRFAGHWRSDRETSGRGWSEGGHHVREGGQRGIRRRQSD